MHGKVIATTRNPDGRVVELQTATWDHVLRAHPEMVDHIDAILRTVEAPKVREPDPRPGRERYFGRAGPERWLRVVVEFAGDRDRVVTAFPQSNDPIGRPQ